MEDLAFLTHIKEEKEKKGNAGDYMWSQGKLYIFKSRHFVEYPPKAFRALIME